MKWIWKEASQEKLCLFQAYFNELFITGQEKLLCVFFCWSSLCKIIMATWSEGGGVREQEGGVPSQTDHLLSPLRSTGPVTVSKQLHYEVDQIKKKTHTTIWCNTISMFKQEQERVRRGSLCWYSPQGWSHQDEKETMVLHNEAACPVGKKQEGHIQYCG